MEIFWSSLGLFTRSLSIKISYGSEVVGINFSRYLNYLNLPSHLLEIGFIRFDLSQVRRKSVKLLRFHGKGICRKFVVYFRPYPWQMSSFLAQSSIIFLKICWRTVDGTEKTQNSSLFPIKPLAGNLSARLTMINFCKRLWASWSCD